LSNPIDIEITEAIQHDVLEDKEKLWKFSNYHKFSIRYLDLNMIKKIFKVLAELLTENLYKLSDDSVTFWGAKMLNCKYVYEQANF